MEKKTFKIRKKTMAHFREYLQERENSAATIEKYMRDMRTFTEFCSGEEEIGKEKLMAYKEWLIGNYSVNSVNSMLAALNQFLAFIGMERLHMKRIRVQRLIYKEMKRAWKRMSFGFLCGQPRQRAKISLP